jgi:hypothetical protein
MPEQAVSDEMFMWTVYDSPSDFPGEFVARKFQIIPAHGPTEEILRFQELQQVRDHFSGLVWLNRMAEDDPCILGVYL